MSKITNPNAQVYNTVEEAEGSVVTSANPDDLGGYYLYADGVTLFSAFPDRGWIELPVYGRTQREKAQDQGPYVFHLDADPEKLAREQVMLGDLRDAFDGVGDGPDRPGDPALPPGLGASP